MDTVKLSSKGQIIIPKAIRERQHWETGTEFIVIDRVTELVIKPTRVFPSTELESPDRPSVYRGKQLSLEDMERAILTEAEKRR